MYPSMNSALGILALRTGARFGLVLPAGATATAFYSCTAHESTNAFDGSISNAASAQAKAGAREALQSSIPAPQRGAPGSTYGTTAYFARPLRRTAPRLCHDIRNDRPKGQGATSDSNGAVAVTLAPCRFGASARTFCSTSAPHAQGQWQSYTAPPGPGPGSSSGAGPLPGSGFAAPHSHGPGPGLPLEPAGGGTAPLQRPDHLRPGGMADPASLAEAHEGDPREIVQRMILQSSTSTRTLPPWGSDLAEVPYEERGNISALCPVDADSLRSLPGPDLAAAALAVMPSLPPARVAALSVALARLGHFDLDYKNALVEHVIGRLYQFTPQQLSDVAWAVAACGYYDLPFLEALAGRLRETAAQWDARSLAKVLWAFGRFHFVGREPSVGAEALEAMMEKLQGEMDGGSVAEVLFAAGQLCGSGCDISLSSKLGNTAQFAINNIGTFGPEALGKLAVGMAALGAGGWEEELCEAVASRAAELAPRLDAVDVCRVLDLLSTYMYQRQPEALEALARRAADLAGGGGGGPANGSGDPAAPRMAPHQAGTLVANFNSLGHVSNAVLALAAFATTPVAPAGSFGG